MNKQRIAILICAAVGMLTTFMPWVNVPIAGSVNGTQGDGWITLSILAVPLILCFLGDRTKSLDGALLYLALAAGIIDAIIAVYKIVDFKNKMSPLADNPFGKLLSSTVSIGFGLYLLAIAGVVLAITSLALKDKQVVVINTPVSETA